MLQLMDKNDQKSLFISTYERAIYAYHKTELNTLSDTEHTAYTVGHPCKPYIQPNQPWPYPSYTRGHSSVSVKTVYDF